MDAAVNVLKQQYILLKGSRHVLFDYCSIFASDDLTKELEGFGHGSINGLFAHIGNTYIHWLQNFALSNGVPYIDKIAIANVDDAREHFVQIDAYVDGFIIAFANKLDVEITGMTTDDNRKLVVTPVTLFTHTLTHEFHHKGQILSMSRQMGYVPVDTDVIRT